MGIYSYIQNQKDNAKKESKDYQEKLVKGEVQTYEKEGLTEKIGDIKAGVKQKLSNLRLYQEERQQAKTESLKKQIETNKVKLEDQRLKVKLQEQQAKLKPTGFGALINNLQKPEIKVKKGKLKQIEQPGKKSVINDPFPGGGNPFG